MLDHLPDFFILGATKCGTFSVYEYLAQHPDIFMSSEKEPHFFDFDYKYRQGLEYYLKEYFKNSEKHLLKGEATPNYLFKTSKVIKRIKETYEECDPKFIVLLRDPVKRAWSHYLHMVRDVREEELFYRALELEKERLKTDEDAWVGYFSEGLYVNQIKKWLDFFPKENFLFLLTEELGKNCQRVCQEIFEFLEVRTWKVENLEHRNTFSVSRSKKFAKWVRKPHPILRNYLNLISTPEYRVKIKNLFRELNYKKTKKPIIDDRIEKFLKREYYKPTKELEVLLGKSLKDWPTLYYKPKS